MTIDFEKDQEEILDKTTNINKLADKIKELQAHQQQLEVQEDAIKQKKELEVDVGDWVECLDWSGDGKTLGCGGGFDKQGKLFDAEDPSL